MAWNGTRSDNIPTVKAGLATFSDVPLLRPEIFHWNDPRSPVPFIVNLKGFPEIFCKWKTTNINFNERLAELKRFLSLIAPVGTKKFWEESSLSKHHRSQNCFINNCSVPVDVEKVTIEKICNLLMIFAGMCFINNNSMVWSFGVFLLW